MNRKNLKLSFVFSLVVTAALAQGVPFKDGQTSSLATVNSSGEISVSLPKNPVDAGYVKLADQNGNAAEILADGHLSTSNDTVLFSDRPIGTVMNPAWNNFATTQTLATSNGYYILNNSNITTAATTSGIQTYRYHPISYPEAPVTGVLTMKVANLPQAQAQLIAGFHNSVNATVPTDGCFFMWNIAGEFRAYMNFNSTIRQSGVLTSPTQNVLHTYTIIADYDQCMYSVDGVVVSTLTTNIVDSVQPSLIQRLPYGVVIANGTTPTLAPSASVAALTTMVSGSSYNSPAPQWLAGVGRGAYQTPLSTYTQTANHANSTSPTSATLSNTAAGYATLGGRWQFAAPASAATDFALFAYPVPAGYQLHVTGIHISACNTGAAVATTATMLDWSLGVNSSAVSLATTDALGPPITAYAPRRIPLSAGQSFAVGALAGACAPDIVHTFVTPLVVEGGRYLHVIVQVPVGTATASQVIRGDVMVEGYFE